MTLFKKSVVKKRSLFQQCWQIKAHDFNSTSGLSDQAWECSNDSVLILLKQIVQVPSLQQHYLHMCLVPSFRTTDRSPSNALSLVRLKNNHCCSQSPNFAGRRIIRGWKMGSSSHWLDFSKADMWHLWKGAKSKYRVSNPVQLSNERVLRVLRWPVILIFEHKCPNFFLKLCSNGLRKTWFKFLGTLPSKCWPNSMRVFVCVSGQGRNVT